MGWVTLDDGQHIFIGSGGKVLASRSKISSAGGGKERGTRAIEHARAAGPTLREQADKARAAKGNYEARIGKLTGKAMNLVKSRGKEAITLNRQQQDLEQKKRNTFQSDKKAHRSVDKQIATVSKAYAIAAEKNQPQIARMKKIRDAYTRAVQTGRK